MESGSQYRSKLNEYAQKSGLKPPEYVFESSGPDHKKEFKATVRLNGEVFPEGVGSKKDVASNNAAKNAFEILIKRTQATAAVTTDQDVNHASGQTSEDELCKKTGNLSVNKENTNFTKMVDYVSIVHNYCQKTNQMYDTEVSREGPPHDPVFSCRLKISNQLYPVGEAKKKKDAEKIAAQLAWAALQEQSDFDSKVSLGSAVSQDDTSEITPTSTTPSSVLEPEPSAQSTQWTGSDSIQFKDSSKLSSVQDTSSTQDTDLETNTGDVLTATSELQRFNLDFDCIELLGEGSFGSVYKARHILSKKYRAIKEIRFKKLDKSLKEVNVLSDLNHPNVMAYYTCWLQDIGYSSMHKSNSKFLFIELELCDGGTLRCWIRTQNRDSSEKSRQCESVKLAQQILSGVEYIHSKKLIHRDLKPENILFGQNGTVKIGDFGLATQDSDDEEIVERSADKGTRSYMAPEQVGVNYDHKVDIFALGLIFFELLWRIATGHERVKIFEAARHQDLPKEFTKTYPIESRIIKTMLSEKPEDRQEASALKTELEKWTRTPDQNTDQTV